MFQEFFPKKFSVLRFFFSFFKTRLIILMIQIMVEFIKEEKSENRIYSVVISSGWEKYGGFAKKAKLSLKKSKKTYIWRWCRSSVRNQSVASLIRNAIGISSVRAMPDPHQPVSNRALFRIFMMIHRLMRAIFFYLSCSDW